jgi:hypothetical protein
MAAVDQEFTVANVIDVTPQVAIVSFPAFPHGGTLVVLQPPCVVADHELTGYFAEISISQGRTLRIGYKHWHVNADNVIGLLSTTPGASEIPPGSVVRFVKR